MYDEVIVNFRAQADFSEAIEGAKTFNKEMDSTSKKAEDIGKVLDYITNKDNEADTRTIFGEKYESLLEVKTILTDINTEMATLKQGFSGRLIDDNFVRLGEQRLRSLERALHGLGVEAANLYEGKQSKETVFGFLSSAHNADIAKRDLQDLRSMFGFQRESPDSTKIVSTGTGIYDLLKPAQVAKLLKAQGYADKEIRKLNAGARNMLSLDELSGLLAQRSIVEGALAEAAPGQTFSEQQKREIAKMFVYRSRNYKNNNVFQAAEALRLKNSVSPNFVLETIPEGLREAYSTYGAAGKAKGIDLSSMVDKKAMDQFVRLIVHGNRAAIETGLNSNIIQMDRGRFVFGKTTLEHWSKLASETAKYIRDAQSGVPYLWADITDPNDQERILRRQSKKYQDAEKLAEVIGLQQGYVADTSLKPTFQKDDKRTYRKVKMTKGWYPDQYIIPQTILDPTTLQPIYRDPEMQLELEHGKTIFDKTADMPFVTMGSNSITQLLGFKGNNTAGYGRDANGNPLRPKKPILFELNMRPMIGEDDDREYVVTNSDLYNAHVDIGNRTRKTRYGDTDYVYGWSGGDTQNMIQADVYELLTGRGKIQSRKRNPNPETNADLKAWRERLAPLELPEEMFNTIYDNAAYIRRNGLGHLFDNFFAGEMLPTDAKGQNQFIERGKKKATPGFSIRDLGFKRGPRLTLADFSSLYDLFGVEKTDSFMRLQPRIDGPIYVMPEFAPSGLGFQNRAGFGGIKSMAIPENFKYIMQNGGILDAIYNTHNFDYLFNRRENVNKPKYKDEYEKAQKVVENLQTEYDDISAQIAIADENASDDLKKKQATVKKRLNRAKKWLGKKETDYKDAPDYLYDFYAPMIGLEKELDAEGKATGDLIIQNEKGEKVALFKHLAEQQKIINENKSQQEVQAAKQEISRVQEKYMKNVVGDKVEAVVTDTAAKLDYSKMELEDYYQMFGNPNIPYANETPEKKAKREARLKDLNARTENGIVRLTAKEQDIYANKATDIVGMQVNKLTPDFEGVKDYIPASMAIAVGATQKMIDMSHEEYVKAREALNSEEGQKAFLMTLPRGRQILAQHAADWQRNEDAIRLIENQKQKLIQDEEEGHLLFPGQMGMAASGPKPGSLGVGLMSGKNVNANVHDLPETSIKGLLVNVNDANSIVAASPLFKNWQSVSASRHPAAPGEFVPAIENYALSPNMRRMLRSVGADPRFAYLNPQQQYEMNSGDFDGDTTWIFKDISGDLFNEMRYIKRKMFDAKKYLKDNNMIKESTEFGTPAKSIGEAQVNFLLNHLNAQNEMALYSSGIRNAMTGWKDDDEKWLALAMNVDAYDKATSERMKQGLRVSISGAGDRASKEGATFSRLIKQLNGLKDKEEDAYVGLFGAKTPALNDTAALKHVVGTFISRQKGELPNDYLAQELDYWISNNFDEDTYRGKAARKYGDVLSNYFTGRKIADKDDVISLLSSVNSWQADIDRRKKAGENSKALDDEQSELNSLRARITYLREHGITKENVSSQIATLNTEANKYRGWQNAFLANKNAISADAYVDVFGKAAFATAKKSTKEGEEELYQLSDENAKVYEATLEAKLKGREDSIKALRTLIAPKDGYLEFLDHLADTEDAQQKEAVEALRKRAMLSSEGQSIIPETVDDLKKYLHAETVSKRTKMNWSDIAPWMHKAMEDSHFQLEGIKRESLMPTGHRLNTNFGTATTVSPNNAEFDPFPYGKDKAEQRAIIMARELDNRGKIIQPFEMNEAIYGGKLRHKAFEMFFKSRALASANLDSRVLQMINDEASENGKVDDDYTEVLGVKELSNLTPGEILSRMIMSRKSVQQFAEFGLGVRRKENGEIELAVRDDASNVRAAKNLKESLENALGDFVDGKYQGGTLNAIAGKILSNGETVVNIEGLNIENGQALNEDELKGRGVLYNFGALRTPLTELAKPEEERNKNVKKEDIVGTFAPDLITRDRNGLYTMHDYKTSEAGAIDSLYQQYVYITNTLNKARQEITEGTNKGWSRFLSDDVKAKALELQSKGQLTEGAWNELIANSSNPLKFKEIKAYDTVLGGMLTLGYNEDTRRRIWDYSQQGRILKQQEAESGYEEGIEYLRQQMMERFGKDWEKKGGRTVQSALASTSSKGGYVDFLSHKFGEDQEKIDEIYSKLYRESLKQDKISGGGYNRFESMRRQLEETLPPDLYNAINKKLTKANDEIGLQVLSAVRAKKERAEDELSKVERTAAVEDWDSLKDNMRKSFFSVKENSSLSAIFDTVTQANSVRKIRESWIKNPKLYNEQTGQWTEEGQKDLEDVLGNKIAGSSYAAMYRKAEEEDKKFMDEFRASLPVLTENSIRSNDQQLRSLLKDNTKHNATAELQDAYQKRIDALAKYVREQDATISKAEEELAQRVSNEADAAFSLEGPERKAVESILANAKTNRVKAADALNDQDVKRAVLNEQMKQLGLTSESAHDKAQRWVNQRLAALDESDKTPDSKRIREAEEEAQKAEAEFNQFTLGHSMMLPMQGKKEEMVAYDASTKSAYRKWQDAQQNLETAKTEQIKQNEIQRNVVKAEGELIEKRIERDAEMRIEEFDRMTSGTQTTREDRIKAKLKAAQDHALNQAINPDLSEEERKEWEKRTFDEQYWNNYEKMLNAQENTNESYRKLVLQHRESATNVRNQNILHQQELSQQQWQRQRRRQFTRSRVAQSIYGLEDRQISLREQIRGYEQQNTKLNERQEVLKELLKTPGLSDEKRKEYELEQKNNKNTIETNAEAIRRANKEVEQLGTFTSRAGAAFQGLGQSLSMIAHRLGRQLFMKALQETKRFVKEFDASMNEIQAITLKSDKEMQSIRSQTINKALGLRTSVSNVSNVEAALYRQGLSDAEVQFRTESIIKFATVTKLNVQEATKIITTALQNDLVQSANEAMDALVALGDSAATTAAEIGKGMQKAAAAAKVAGVSYSELTALLTIGTSDTQLSGTQVGTALQTVFSRMRRLSMSGWTADQNGEKTTANDAEAALKAVGVDLWDDKALGKMRSAYDVLSDLSKVWQNLSDAQKNIVMNAMAGTRQTNVFATLMEGMSENNGETLDKYLGLAEGSEGVTQSKYEIAMQSLAASMDTLKSSWDAIVESFTNSGIVTDVIDGISNKLQDIANVADNGGKIGIGLSAIAAGVVALLSSFVPGAKILGVIAAVGTFLTGINIASSIFSEEEEKSIKELNQKKLDNISYLKEYNDNDTSKRNKAIEDVKKAGEAWNKVNNTETSDNLRVSLENLADTFPTLSGEIENALKNLNKWTEAVDAAQKKTNEFSHNEAKKVIDETNRYIKTSLRSDYVSYMEDNFISNKEKNDIVSAFVSGATVGRIESQSGGLAEFFGINNVAKSTVSGQAKYKIYDSKTILNNLKTNKAKAEALTNAYRNNETFKNFAKKYLNSTTQAILDDETNKTPYDEEAFSDAAAGELDLLFERLNKTDHWQIQTSMSDALNYRYDNNQAINVIPKAMTNGIVDYSKLSSLNPHEKAVVMSQALVGSRELQDWVLKREGGQDLLKDLFYVGNDGHLMLDVDEKVNKHENELATLSDELIEEANTSGRRQATRAFLEQRLPEVLSTEFELMAAQSDKFDANKIQEMFIEALASEMNNNPDEYFKDGTYKPEAVEAFVSQFSDDWWNDPAGYLSHFAKKYLTFDKFKYHFDENDAETWFDDYNQAVEYAIQNGIDPTRMKLANGNSAYQGVEALFTAKELEANTNNQNYIANQILNGISPDISKIEEVHQKRIAERLAGASTGTKYEETLRKIQNGEITYSDLPENLQEAVKSINGINVIESLSKYKNFTDLYNAYDTGGQSSILANYVAGNAEAAAAVLANDYNLFADIVKEAKPGVSTTASRAEIMRKFGDIFSGENGAEAAEKFRTNALTTKAYETWQSFFGENADAIIDAMTSPEGLNGDLLELYNQTLAEKGIALGTGLKQFTGTELARNAQRVLSQGDWTKAQETFKDWTTDEWSALENKYPDLKRYLQMTEEQRASQEGQNLRRNIEIQISVADVSALEEANKVLEGTTSLIENLQKGGEIELKAKLSFEENFAQKLQTLAILQNGTFNEINEVLRSLGFSDYDIQNNREESIRKATTSAEDVVKNVSAESLNKLYKEDPEEAQRLASIYEFTRIQKNKPLPTKKNAPHVLQDIEYGYKYTGTPEIRRTSSLYNASNYYSDEQIADAMRGIIEGTLDINKDFNLYSAAESHMGTYGTEYMRMQYQKEQANEAGQTLDEVRTLALNEIAKATREGFSSDLTKILEQSTDAAIRENASNIVSAASTLKFGSTIQQNEFFNSQTSQARAGENALFALRLGNTEEARSIISNFIGMEDKDLENLWNGKNGEQEVRQQIQDNIDNSQMIFTQALLAVIPEGTDIDVDFTDIEKTATQIENALQETNSALATLFVKWLKATSGVQVSVYDSISELNKKERDAASKRTKALNAVGELFTSENFSEDANKFITDKEYDKTVLSSALRFMLESAANNEGIFSIEDIQSVYQDELYGRTMSNASQKAIINSLFGESATAENMAEKYREWKSTNDMSRLNVLELLPKFNELSAILNNDYETEADRQAALDNFMAGLSTSLGTGLKQFTSTETGALARKALSYKDWNEAQQKLNGDEVAVLRSQYPEVEKYLSMNSTQRRSEEGQNILRNINIKIDVDGLRTLEEAGKLLAGTADLVEKLKKGGRFEIEAIMNIRTETYKQGQLEAALTQGTAEEQRQAIIQLTGATEAQVIAEPERWRAEADKELARQWEDIAKARTEERKSVTDKNAFDQNMLDAGLEWVEEEVDEHGRIIDEPINGRYVHKGGQTLDYVSALDKATRRYSSMDIVSGARSLLNGETLDKEYAEEVYKNNPLLLEYLRRQKENLTDEQYLARYGVSRSDYLNQVNQSLNENERKAYQEEIQQRYAGLSYGNEIASNAATMKYGTARERQSLLYGNEQALETAKNVQYYLENWNEDSAGIIAGYLGKEEKNIEKEDVKELQEEINNVVKEELIKQAASYGADMTGLSVDSSMEDVKSALEQALNTLSGEARDKVQEIIDDITPEGTVTGEQAKTGALQKAEDAYIAQLANDETLREIINFAKPGQALATLYHKGGIFNNKAEFDNFIEKNPNLSNIFGRVSTEGFTQTTIDELANAATSAGLNYNQTASTQYAAFKEMLNQNGGLNIEEFKNKYNTDDVFRSWADSLSSVKDAMADVEGTTNGTGQAFERLASEALISAIESTNAFGDSTKDVIETIRQMNGTLNDQNQLLIKNRKLYNESSNVNYLKEQFQKKKRSSDLTSFLEGRGFSKQQINTALSKTNDEAKALYKEMLDEFTRAQDEYNAQLSVDFNAKMVEGLDELNTKIAGQPDLFIQGPGVTVNGGEVTFDAQEFLNRFNDVLNDVQRAQVQDAIAKKLTITAVTEQKGADTIISSFKVSNTNAARSGGSGGGGKSATDKLLEQQKLKIAEIEHQSKMLEIQEKHLDFVNDYSGWDKNIDSQIDIQEKLRTQYAANLDEMNKMLSKVKEGSDDWKKLKEAIMSAEEAMASINNTIDELNAKRISILQQQQENADKPGAHRLSMQQKYAARYQRSDQFEGYVAMTELALETTKAQLEQNKSQIKDWEDLLLEYEENSDSWIEVRDNIWKLKEENAELENQMASDMIDLQDAKIAQITKDLQSEASPYEHANTMLETYGGMYQSMNNQPKYRMTLEDTIANNRTLKALNDDAIAQLKAEIDRMEESDPSRQNAIDALYQLEEASAKYEASILSNRQAIEESLIGELQTAYSDSGSILEHEMKLLTEAEKEFLRNDDFVNYENILMEKSRNTAEQLENQKNALADYLALQESGDITEGSQQWKDLENTIRSTEESIAELTNSYQEAVDAVQKAQFDNVQKQYQDIIAQTEHELNLIRYQQTLYQNRGELTNYGTALGWEHERIETRQTEVSDQINRLKELQDLHKDNPELYDQETDAIRKLEEEESKLTIELEKNEKAQKKNIDAILQVKATVLNTIDKAIRENIQKEKTMLSATIGIQNTILDTIRKSYEEQWALEKKTIEQKKQNLNEEKNLISERVNFRKKMMDQENKDEELAELKRQYTLISADSTRTKEANEILRKIREMEKEQAIQDAEDIANAEIKSRDDQINALNNYVTVAEEDLSNYLKNANNFTEEFDKILQGSYEEWLAWYAENNTDYKYKTAEEQEKMKQDFEDQWYEAFGLIRTYWEQANDIVKSKEGFIAYASSLDSFRAKSEEEQKIYEHSLEEQWDLWQASLVDNAEFNDEHDIVDTIEELKDWTFKVRLTDLEDYDFGPYSDYVYKRNRGYDPYVDDEDYHGVGKIIEPATIVENTPTSDKGKNNTPIYTATAVYSGYGPNGFVSVTAKGTGTSKDDAEKAAYDNAKALFNKRNSNGSNYAPGTGVYYGEGGNTDIYGAGTPVTDTNLDKTFSTDTSAVNKLKQELEAAAKEAAKTMVFTEKDIYLNDEKKKKQAAIKSGNYLYANENGGLVDYTGLTWVDGTKAKPESFLDSTDTALLRSMLDTFTYVKNTPYMTHIDTSNYGKPNVSIGDVNVNLYEAKLEEDADYSKIAAKVGEAFTKELQKDGFNLVNYAW